MPGVVGSGAALPSMLATDVRGLEALRGKAAADPKAAVRQAARQFEALFMQELMKSMRATTLASADSLGGTGSTGAMGTEMLDGQYAQQLAGLPGGLHPGAARSLGRALSSPGSARGEPPGGLAGRIPAHGRRLAANPRLPLPRHRFAARVGSRRARGGSAG